MKLQNYELYFFYESLKMSNIFCLFSFISNVLISYFNNLYIYIFS